MHGHSTRERRILRLLRVAWRRRAHAKNRSFEHFLRNAAPRTTRASGGHGRRAKHNKKEMEGIFKLEGTGYKLKVDKDSVTEDELKTLQVRLAELSRIKFTKS